MNREDVFHRNDAPGVDGPPAIYRRLRDPFSPAGAPGSVPVQQGDLALGDGSDAECFRFTLYGEREGDYELVAVAYRLVAPRPAAGGNPGGPAQSIPLAVHAVTVTLADGNNCAQAGPKRFCTTHPTALAFPAGADGVLFLCKSVPAPGAPPAPDPAQWQWSVFPWACSG